MQFLKWWITCGIGLVIAGCAFANRSPVAESPDLPPVVAVTVPHDMTPSPPRAPSHTPTASSLPSPEPAVSAPVVAHISDSVVNFVWDQDTYQIYYQQYQGESQPDEWYAYDLHTGATRPSSYVLPGISATTFNRLTWHGGIGVFNISPSPSGEKVLYERLPDGFVMPTPSGSPMEPTEFMFLELWLGEDHGITSRKIEHDDELGHCELADKSEWRLDETLILGSCKPRFSDGTPVWYFLVNTVNNTFDRLGVSGGWAFQATLSPNGEWLAIVDEQQRLWLFPVELFNQSSVVSAGEEHRVDLPDPRIVALAWSPDNQWVYILHYTNHALELARVHADTGQMETVLTEFDLQHLFSAEDYELWDSRDTFLAELYVSPDGKYILAGFSGGSSLWLLSLPE